MRWSMLLVALLGCVLGTLRAAEETKKSSYVDLQPKANQKLTGSFGSGFKGNNLASLPTGEKTLEKVKFKIGDGLLQLGRQQPKLKEPKPNRVDDMQVGKVFAKLHILHGTVGGAYQPKQIVPDDTKIAKYVVHYEDGATETIPVVYGKDVRDFFNHDDSKEVTRGKVAWKGNNEYSKKGELIRLYLSTWENPHPTKKVVSIDYLKVGDTPCAPFCVAMTLEEK